MDKNNLKAARQPMAAVGVARWALAAVLLAWALMLTASAQARTFLVGVSGDCVPGEIELRRTLNAIIDQHLAPGDTLSVYDAPGRALVMDLKVPDQEIFRNPAIRQNDPELAPQRRQLKAFLKARCSAAAPSDHSGSLMAPQFLADLARHRLALGSDVQILLIGSALHVDARDGLDFRQGRYPSDGMLNQRARESVLGTRDRVAAGHFAVEDDLGYIAMAMKQFYDAKVVAKP